MGDAIVTGFGQGVVTLEPIEVVVEPGFDPGAKMIPFVTAGESEVIGYVRASTWRAAGCPLQFLVALSAVVVP